ncbi:Anti-sigma regulatory factor (Ser/Thr protein kinase) [Butyrivibrio proteoclasticus]|uniref:Anti-sigma regulatory factor (Ser/Thr protein kinase) n=1 Tax=Butyrivibrio proteoclasticus TaxID=43305 RepID=A0A1I5UFH9_9FIRM|nr:ATP-binding protein [Butyrivibrio proteoclasticus]SFP93787.1 Anti-sigma regulatory factor (Ser/Thr protein kinase) [Butyrivibrio proteoclasticus]
MSVLKIDAQVQKLDEVIGFIDAELEKAGASMKVQMQIDVAVEEIFVNIASYAYDGKGGQAEIQYDFRTEDSTAVITFIDQGIYFDPLKKEDPDTGLSAEERQIGGLGIFIVKKSMDKVSYKNENGCNILTIEKVIT